MTTVRPSRSNRKPGVALMFTFALMFAFVFNLAATTASAQPNTKSVFIPTPEKIEQRSAVAIEYRNAPNNKAFYDKYSLPIYAVDGVATFYRFKAMNDCGMWARVGVDDFATGVVPNYPANQSPEAQAQIKMISGQVQRCVGFPEALDMKLIRETLNNALLLNDPGAVAFMLRSFDKPNMLAETESMARQLLFNPNPDVAVGVLRYLDTRVKGWNPDDLGAPTNDVRRDAWRLASCAWGADCGPNDPNLREACIAHRVCDAPSYEAYLQRHVHSPADFERVQQLAKLIVDSVAARNWAALGLATTKAGPSTR